MKGPIQEPCPRPCGDTGAATVLTDAAQRVGSPLAGGTGRFLAFATAVQLGAVLCRSAGHTFCGFP